MFDPNDQYQTPDGDVLQAENYYKVVSLLVVERKGISGTSWNVDCILKGSSELMKWLLLDDFIIFKFVSQTFYQP